MMQSELSYQKMNLILYDFQIALIEKMLIENLIKIYRFESKHPPIITGVILYDLIIYEIV